MDGALEIGERRDGSAGMLIGKASCGVADNDAGKLKGLTTEWEFKEGVWLKKMNAMTITRGEIVKLFEADTLQ